MILCADDFLTPGALAAAIDVLERDPAVAFVLGSRSEEWLDGTEGGGDHAFSGHEVIAGRAFVAEVCDSLAQDLPCHEVVVRRALQQRVGHYRAALPHMDDLEMVLRLALCGSVAKVHGSLIAKRVHAENRLSVLWQDRLADLKERDAAFESFFAREGAQVAAAARLHATTKRRLAELAVWSAVSHTCRGHFAAALQLLRFGFRLSPTSVLLPPIGRTFRSRGGLGRVAAVLAESWREMSWNSGPARPRDSRD